MPGIELAPGGALTFATVLRRLGDTVSLIGAVGNDWPWRYLSSHCLIEGISVSEMFLSDDTSTPIAVVAVNAVGDARYMYMPGPAPDLFAAAVNGQIGVVGTILHVSGFNELCGENAEPVYSWLLELRASLPQLVVTVDTAKHLHAKPCLEQLAPMIDYFFANQREAERLTGHETLRGMSREVFKLGVRRGVCIKLAERGAYWATPESEGIEEGYVVETVNENGAGDVFCAGAVHYLANGSADLATAVRLGNVLAASHVKDRRGIVSGRSSINPDELLRESENCLRSGRVSMETSVPLHLFSAVEERFPERFDTSQELDGQELDWWVQMMRLHGKVGGESKVLDAACGTGRFAIPFLDILGCDVVGVDGSPPMIARARKKAKGVHWKIAKLERLDSELPPGTFDCVFLSGALPHVRDLRQVFDQLHGQLKVGGRLVMRTSTPELAATIDWLRYFPEGRRFEIDNQKSLTETTAVLADVGFRVRHIELRDEDETMYLSDFTARLNARGFVWSFLFDDVKYEDCVVRFRKETEPLHDQIVVRDPQYLIVSEKIPSPQLGGNL